MKKAIITAVTVLIIFGGGYAAWKYGLLRNGCGAPVAGAPQGSGAAPQAIAEIPTYQYTETYANETYGFSFNYPKDFSVSELPSENGIAIVVQNVATKIGVQIAISPFQGPEIDITADVVHADLPDLTITDAQTITIGQNRNGLAFMSDNPVFGGKSREAWFVYRGYLYQISTYAELDEFLKGLFATWQFNY